MPVPPGPDHADSPYGSRRQTNRRLGGGADWTTDPGRLRALRRYEVLDTEPEEAYDAIAELAAHLFDAPSDEAEIALEDPAASA